MMFDIHQEHALGASYASPDGSTTIRLFMIGFVDDAYGSVNDFSRTPAPSLTELVSMAQKDSQLWSDLLHRSGGALELAKSKYHTISYLFTPSGAPVLQGGQAGLNLCVTSGDRSSTMKFQYLSAHTAHKTLGCYRCLLGAMAAGIEALERLTRTPASTTGKMATVWPGAQPHLVSILNKKYKTTHPDQTWYLRNIYPDKAQERFSPTPRDNSTPPQRCISRIGGVSSSSNQSEALSWIIPHLPCPLLRTFTDYISTLRPWERILFDELDMTVSPYDIITAIQLHEAIYSASDGSVKDNQGSFGWLLSSPVILRCSGPAFGMRMKWYRAEGYGVLSVLRIIYRLYTFFTQPLSTNLHLFCDSKSLLDKTTIYTKHTRYFPNTSLQPDWDVVQQIVTMWEYPLLDNDGYD
jgi:hypothetical protein